MFLNRELLWLQKQKGLSRKSFEAQEWLDLLLALNEEDILENFREFYLWTDKQTWVNNVTPKLLRRQIEPFKKAKELKKNKNSLSETASEYIERKRSENTLNIQRFDRSLNRCQGWCEENGKEFSHGYFDQWLQTDYERWLDRNS